MQFQQLRLARIRLLGFPPEGLERAGGGGGQDGGGRLFFVSEERGEDAQVSSKW